MSLVSLMVAGCDLLAFGWPDRRGRTPEQMVADVIRWQQLKHVRRSTGELAHECFTDVNLEEFRQGNVPARVVARLKRDADFGAIAAALRALPRERLTTTLRDARRIARPTWRVMGHIDRDGNGQTEAGHIADLAIGEAVVDAFAQAVGVPAA